MRPTHSPTAGPTVARLLTAAASLLTLTAALAGLPLLLLAWATPLVWAAGHDDLTHLLTRQDTGAVFLLLLLALGWMGWAQFAFCTVRELIAQLRGLTWHAPRGLGASQRAAAVLIGGILVLLPTSSALASPAQASQPATAVHLPLQGQTAQQPAAAGQTALSAASAGDTRIYTVREVRPAESLWSIAERELGDGERWRQIAALNEGRTMADGQVFRANSFLQPGWQLRLPAPAAAAPGTHPQSADNSPTDAGRSRVVTVAPGDSLSKIAQAQFGQADQWPVLFKASRGAPQPQGLPDITDPDVIYAGQQVTVPHAPPAQHDPDSGDPDGDRQSNRPPTKSPSAHPRDGEHQPSHDPGHAQAPPPPSAAPTPDTPTSRAPRSHPSRTVGSGQATEAATPPPTARSSPPARTPSAPVDAPPTTAAAPPAPASPSARPVMPVRTVLGAGAVLAAAITGALALRRLLQRRRRKPGEQIALIPETSPAEAQLAAAAEPQSAARLDLALRTLAHQAAQDGEGPGRLPSVRAARIAARTLELFPEDPAAQPLTPFVAGRSGWWTLPDDARLLDEETAHQVPAPYPGLVTVGTASAGDLVLLNLAQMSALLLDGSPLDITGVCTALALEYAMSPWAGEVEIITVGFGEDLPHLLPTSRIAHMRQATHALRDLTERLLEAHQTATPPQQPHPPYLLLCADALDADTAWQFADLIDKTDTVPVTLVAPARSAAAHFPHADILNASLDEPQPLELVDTAITVQRLDHAAYQQITTALAVSGQPAEPAQGPWQHVPHEPDARTQPEAGQPEDPASPGDDSTSTRTNGVPAPAGDTGEMAVFPALLAASTDPAAPGLPGAVQHPAPETEKDRAGAGPAAPARAVPAAQSVTSRVDGSDNGQEPHAPQIRVLGPIEVDGVAFTGHGPRMAHLAALLYFRPGRTADVLCADMDPLNPWTPATLNARLQGLRRALGNDPSGAPYVPRRRLGEDPYRLSPAVRCDWSDFLHLVEHALPHGPAALHDLEQALGLVRGRPFGARPVPWAEPHQQEMATRIIDVAHTVATYRTAAGPHHDLSKARRAIATGLDVDDSAELLYRDWMRIEHTAHNRSGLHTAITRIQQVNRMLDVSLETETEQLINDLLGKHTYTPHVEAP
ncbi:LysM peptidoglycan-binding domain-containing protein [Streptomyces sp. MI02-2A]|uniref:LysM peptidoglycan-binding domain-containing protein n=1 Tax=Streptomyces sp. MI02-2A TaxID=3028688 RepID=UPI0029BAA9A5|nr:LysM peptidoglycan-binding domain-containing protein [Streptomyces sp. MI02-2A]MDX3262913.1 LysM peptidoglycan-binding domain-containing protein [Streptomyces sp. MI02-2A]